jgi:hypothetical protein
MIFGLGFFRIVAPYFGDLASQEQELEGIFVKLPFFIIIINIGFHYTNFFHNLELKIVYSNMF